MEPLFEPAAERVLSELEKDPAHDRFVDAIWDAIDLATQHPDSAEARRRALRTPAGHTVWLVPVQILHGDDRWVVLWQPRGTDTLIAYIGPDDFQS